jgi:hypothetical protein
MLPAAGGGTTEAPKSVEALLSAVVLSLGLSDSINDNLKKIIEKILKLDSLP